MRKPEDIRIEYTEGYEPSPSDLPLIHAFREQVLLHGDAVGVPFEILEINPAPNKHRHTEVHTCGTAENELGEKIFKTPISDIIDLTSKGDSEGTIKHEAWHHKLPPLKVLIKLGGIVLTSGSITSAHDEIEENPAVLLRLRKEFGTLRAFKAALAQFASGGIKFIKFLEGEPELLSASPEQLAFWIENNAAFYGKLKEALELLPAAKDSKTFYISMAVADALPLKGRHVFNTAAKALLSPTLAYTGLPAYAGSLRSKELLLEKFSNRLAKAAEYTADSGAHKDSKNTDSVQNMLRGIAEQEAEETGDLDKAWNDDSDTYPSNRKRFERIEFFKQFGRTPDEAEFFEFMDRRQTPDNKWQKAMERDPAARDRSP